MESTIPRKHSAQAMRDNEERFRLMIEGSEQVFFFMHDREHRFRYLSPSVHRVLGYPPEELIGQPYNVLLSDDPTNAVVDQHTDGALTSGERAPAYLARVWHRDGRPITLELVESPVIREGRVIGIQGFARDVSESERTALRLRESEGRFRSLIENAHDIITVLAADGTIRYESPSIRRIMGYTPEEMLGRNVFDFLHPDDLPGAAEVFARMVGEPGATREMECRFRHWDGSWRYLEITGKNLLDEPTVAGVVVNSRDITERKQSAARLQESEERYRSVVEQVREVIFQTDSQGRWTFLNPAWTEITGFGRAESLGRNWLRFVHPDDQERARAELLDLMARAQDTFRAEVRYRTRDGEVRWIEVQARRTAAGTSGMLYDITERRQAEAKLRRSAFYDPLTGLPNRALFTERLGHALGWVQRHPGQQAAVLFLDVDRFKLVNDSMGHIVGDQLLVDTARRLERAVRPGDTVARLGGDEFAILMEEVTDVADATRVADAIHAELAHPFLAQGQEVFASASIGIALCAGDYTRPEDLLRDADTAMYRAKAHGRGKYEVFDAEMHAHVVALLQMETHLQRALERNEMRVFYQPVIESSSGRIVGFEALVRWQHPERGMIAPAAFVPIAEETGVIVQIDRWVLRQACRTLRDWQERFPSNPALFMSVNLSGRHLADPQLPEVIAAILRETDLDARSLRLEITETMIIENPDATAAVLAKLRALNVELYIDDFGTGYSGLVFLHRFQFDSLKIDRSFISRLTSDVQKREIVRAITALAHNLGMRVVAEGVETPEQFQIMREMKCEQVQGYLFSAPVQAAAAEALLLGQPS